MLWGVAAFGTAKTGVAWLPPEVLGLNWVKEYTVGHELPSPKFRLAGVLEKEMVPSPVATPCWALAGVTGSYALG